MIFYYKLFMLLLVVVLLLFHCRESRTVELLGILTFLVVHVVQGVKSAKSARTLAWHGGSRFPARCAILFLQSWLLLVVTIVTLFFVLILLLRLGHGLGAKTSDLRRCWRRWCRWLSRFRLRLLLL